jgi:cell division protein FtsX
VLILQKKLDAMEYVKSTEYIPKEKAAVELKKRAGRGFYRIPGL